MTLCDRCSGDVSPVYDGEETDEAKNDLRIRTMLLTARWHFVCSPIRPMAPRGKRAVDMRGEEVASLAAGAAAYSVSGYLERVVFLRRWFFKVGEIEVFARHLVMSALCELSPPDSRDLRNYEIKVDDDARKMKADELALWFDRALERVGRRIAEREREAGRAAREVAGERVA
jgi:hypothetical protein